MSALDELFALANDRSDPPALAAMWLFDAAHEDEALADELNVWIWERAETTIAQEIARLRRADQTKRPRGTGRPKNSVTSRFSEALDTYQDTADVEALTSFRLILKTDDHGGEKPLGEMVAADHKFVAGRFQQIGHSSLMMAAVHRQVARLMSARPEATTEEMMTQDQYRGLFAKLTDESEAHELTA